MAGENTSNVNMEDVVVDEGRKTRRNPREKSRDPAASIEARMLRLETAVGETLERVDVLEESVGSIEEKVLVAINEMKASLLEEVGKLREELAQEHREHAQLRAEFVHENGTLRAELAALREDYALCKAAIAGGAVARETQHIRAPEPLKYSGKRCAKELDNFFWSLEVYMDAIGVRADEDKIKTAVPYLSDDAALWWRRRYTDITRGTCRIDTWDDFKRDLKRQFYPENVEAMAMKKLRGLEHKGNVKEYISEFTSLMLELPNMADKDRLFYFIDGLQSWAALEVKRRNVQDLAQAIAVAEDLIEFHRDFSPKRNIRDDYTKGGGDEPREEGEASFQRRDKPTDKGKEKAIDVGKKKVCFLCDGPHYVRECPRKKRLNAIIAQHEEQAEDRQLGALQFLNAIKVKEERRVAPKVGKTKGGLMFVEAKVDGSVTKALVDTGATNNFLAEGEANRLGIKVEKSGGRIKAVNSTSKPIMGVAKQVPVKLAGWEGKMDFTVVPIDDYKVILGMEFLDGMEMVTFRSAQMLSITQSGKTYDVPLIRESVKSRRVSAMRVIKDTEKGCGEDLAKSNRRNDGWGKANMHSKAAIGRKKSSSGTNGKDEKPIELNTQLEEGVYRVRRHRGRRNKACGNPWRGSRRKRPSLDEDVKN